jgi:hypothetical protein
MYVNGKMRLIETISGMGGEGTKYSGMIYLIYCQNFCKCHNIPLTSAIKKCSYINFSIMTLNWRAQTGP